MSELRVKLYNTSPSKSECGTCAFKCVVLLQNSAATADLLWVLRGVRLVLETEHEEHAVLVLPPVIDLCHWDDANHVFLQHQSHIKFKNIPQELFVILKSNQKPDIRQMQIKQYFN